MFTVLSQNGICFDAKQASEVLWWFPGPIRVRVRVTLGLGFGVGGGVMVVSIWWFLGTGVATILYFTIL